MELSNNIIMKISRKAGVQSLSCESYNLLKEIVNTKLIEILKISISISTTKIVMTDDLINALKLLEYTITKFY